MKHEQEQMSLVIAGHVDHGKSTVIGRLLADTGSLPEGKLEQVKRNCERNARPFEYAFLLDALKDEQSQGITIDTARCFFKTAKRHYIIIDAPGHIEFLKNMITGAARAEAALLVIDAKEGVRENSRRHGYMLSLLGIRQVVVLVNKMDLVDYDRQRFEAIRTEYETFLNQIKVQPLTFIPIAAREGENLAQPAERMPWYQGDHVLAFIDGLEKEKKKEEQPFRLPVQDIYKFTEAGDDRRIVAGTVETGTVKVGDEVLFLPSQKKSAIQGIEGFNEPVRREIGPGYATGFTLQTQIYIKPGELMCRADQKLPVVNSTFRVNLFWLGRYPMIKGKRYKIKLATQRAAVYLKELESVLDSAELTADFKKDRVERHDVAQCVLQTLKPLAFDLSGEIAATGRFVIIDNYEIVGGGMITESLANDNLISEHVREETMPEFMPIMVKTVGAPCLVVGGGRIALRKVLVLLRFGCKVTAVAQHWSKGLARLAQREQIVCHTKPFAVKDLFGKRLVVAATDDRKVNRKIARWAKILKIPFNCVDNLEISSFIFPAIHCAGALTLAISTQGAYPAAARRIKRELAGIYGGVYGSYLEKLKEYREQIKTIEPDPQQRRLLLKRLLRVEAQHLIAWQQTDFGEWLQHERESRTQPDRN